MPRPTAFLLTALLLAACNASDASDTPKPTAPAPAPAMVLPSQGGFSPLRPTEIEAPGTGAWVCTPAGAGMGSRCVSRGAAQRPGAVPGVGTPLDVAIEAPVEGPSTAEALAIVRARQALPMDAP